MRIRFSTARDLPVVDEDLAVQHGSVADMLVHPDTGKVEGFFVRIPGFFRSEQLFLSSSDIMHWGLRVVIRGPEALGPVEDRVRLQSLLEDGRVLLGQPILTDTGRALGRCADLQFDTVHFMVEWLWPRKLWRWGDPIPLSQVIEVRKDAILVRDPSVPVPEKEDVKPPLIERLPEAA
ncbi:MAG: PRC-barrel domain-containing protein [Candidatus Peribacteraceae bacterium]|nr:PRC-barrel domain-containing protein [Candidatus Peribacteraceae bacterium]